MKFLRNSPYERLVQFQQMTEADPAPRLDAAGSRGGEFATFSEIGHALIRRWPWISGWTPGNFILPPMGS